MTIFMGNAMKTPILNIYSASSLDPVDFRVGFVTANSFDPACFPPFLCKSAKAALQKQLSVCRHQITLLEGFPCFTLQLKPWQ